MNVIRADGSVRGAIFGRPAATTGTIQAARRSFRGAAAVKLPHHLPAESSPSCSRSLLWLSATFLPACRARRPTGDSRARHRCYATAAAEVASASASAKALAHSRLQAAEADRAKLLAFVSDGGEGTVQDHFDFHRDPFRSGFAQPDGPDLQISDKIQDVQFPNKEETLNMSDDMRARVSSLCLAISQRIRHPYRVSLESIHRLYCQLPEPRMLCLTWQWRNRLLKVMGTPRKRDVESMLRYFALAADIKNAGLTLRRRQWNFALAFATKYAARTTTLEMESALRLWREMEKEAKSNEVTFNILFDAAAKSGNFALADMIYKEMESRGFQFNRFHHVTLIYYFGLKMDSGGIRAAYKEMVDAGEMIDTVALNCVIAGLLRCGEEDAAEETYQRMRNAHAGTSHMPQRDYMTNKVVNQVLMMFTKVGKSHPQLKESLQSSVHLTPDMHTYKLLVLHYAIKVGNLTKVAQYLDEMKHLKVPVHPTLFLALAKGFYLHGGFTGSEWSHQRLQGVLTALYEAKDADITGFRMEPWLIVWILRAVKKCSSNDDVAKTFDALSQRWDIKEERLQFIHTIFDIIINDRDMMSPRKKNAEL